MTQTPWEHEIWNVEPLWNGRTAFVLASGPSLTQPIADRLRGQSVMVINSTFKLAPWADVWFFTDNNVFTDNRVAVEAWPGHVITLSKQAKRELPKKVKRVRAEWCPGFKTAGDGVVKQGRSSGHTGISVAVALGAARIVLLGYDMRTVDGREHHHDDYAGRPRDLDIYQREFIPGFQSFEHAGVIYPGWNDAARQHGVEILNATPGSALREFAFVDLDDVLSELMGVAA